MKYRQSVLLLIVFSVLCVLPVYAADNSMSFFVTSIGSGKGGDLGGLCNRSVVRLGMEDGPLVWFIDLSVLDHGHFKNPDEPGLAGDTIE